MDIVIGEYKLSIGKNSVFYPANGNKKKGGGIPLQYFEERLLPKFRILNDEGFIKNEMQKCILLCANCHMIEHSTKNDEKFMKEALNYKGRTLKF